MPKRNTFRALESLLKKQRVLSHCRVGRCHTAIEQEMRTTVSAVLLLYKSIKPPKPKGEVN